MRLRPGDPLLPEGGGGRRVARARAGRPRRTRRRSRRSGSDEVGYAPQGASTTVSTAKRGYVVRSGAARNARSGRIRSTVTITLAAAFTSSESIQTSFGSTRTFPRVSAASAWTIATSTGSARARDVRLARRLVDLLARRLRVEGEHVGAEPGLRRDERQAVARRLQPADQRVLAVLLDLHLARTGRRRGSGARGRSPRARRGPRSPCGRSPRRRATRPASRGRSRRASGRAPSGARAPARTPSGPRSSRARRARSWRRRRPPRPPPPASGACSPNRRIRC